MFLFAQCLSELYWLYVPEKAADCCRNIWSRAPHPLLAHVAWTLSSIYREQWLIGSPMRGPHHNNVGAVLMAIFRKRHRCVAPATENEPIHKDYVQHSKCFYIPAESGPSTVFVLLTADQSVHRSVWSAWWADYHSAQLMYFSLVSAFVL